MSNGYIVAAAADIEAGREIAAGFGLDLLAIAAAADAEAATVALANAANIGLLLSEAAARNESFVGLMQALSQKLGQAQLIVASAEARAAFAYLPASWPTMSLDEARARVAELMRRRQAEAQPAPPAEEGAAPGSEAAPEQAAEESQAQAEAASAPEQSAAPAEAAPEADTAQPQGLEPPSPREEATPAEAPLSEEAAAETPTDEAAMPESAEPAAAAESAQEAAGGAAGAPAEGEAPDDSALASAEPATPETQEAEAGDLDVPAFLRREVEGAPPPAQAAPIPAPAPPALEPEAPPAPRAAPAEPAEAAPAAPADATAFAPTKLRRGSPELVRIVVHQPKQLAAVIKAAKKIDPRAEAAPQGMRIGDVALGASVGIALDVRGASCDGALHRRTWSGEPIDFNFTVQADDSAKQAVFLARVFIDDAQIGVVAFTRKIVGPAKKAASSERVRLSRHKRVFISYSSQDREAVALIAAAYARVGVPHFWDRTSLKSGEDWKPRLIREIDRADLFHLCWSKAAAQSEWVEKEAAHALKRNKRSKGKSPEITVQMLDGPPWAKHPASLDEINFDDFLRAAVVGYARGDGASST